MKRKLLFSTLALLCFGATASAAGTSQALYEAAPGTVGEVAQVCHEAGCGCEVPCDCDSGCEASCGIEADCGCEDVCDSGCDGGCDGGCGGLGLADHMDKCMLLGGCDLGEPFALFGESCGYAAGGWVQMGYHNNATPLFNSRPDEFQLHQAWLWAEKAIDTSCGFDIGGRIDYMYGTDSQDTQAFGIGNNHWDNSWDNGTDYGHAMPQLYLEAGYGDLSVKVGHFYTIIGWEVVTAPDNFFYSHAYTMYNSEPFTHTGALGTYALSEDVEVWGGYTFGWDSGFEDNGDSFLGGVSLAVNEDVSLIYATVGGRFVDNADNGGTVEKGYMHSLIADVALTDCLQYIFQNDYLDTSDRDGALVRNTVGINQYLIYSLSDCLAAGTRFEWYQQRGVFSANRTDIYALTLGVNVKPHANLLVRPEVRFDWDDQNVAGLDQGDQQTTFGIDTIFLF